jgi:hypothetical protein
MKMNREQAITTLFHFTRLIQPDPVRVLRDDEVAKAFAVILRYIADCLSEETTASTRSFKKRRQGYAIEKHSQRIKREGVR